MDLGARGACEGEWGPRGCQSPDFTESCPSFSLELLPTREHASGQMSISSLLSRTHEPPLATPSLQKRMWASLPQSKNLNQHKCSNMNKSSAPGTPLPGSENSALVVSMAPSNLLNTPSSVQWALQCCLCRSFGRKIKGSICKVSGTVSAHSKGSRSTLKN